MKKAKYSTSFSMLALTVSLFASGVAPAAEWIKSYGTGNNEFGIAQPASKGGYYLSMISVASAKNAKPASLFSLLNANGAPKWTKKITTGAYDHYLLSELSNGKILLQGTTQSSASGPTDAVWAVYDIDRTTGQLSPVFRKAYKGQASDTLNISEDASGVLWGAGSTGSFTQDSIGTDMIVAKINPATGVPVWSKVYDYNGNNETIAAFIPKGNQFILLANAQGADVSEQKILLGLLNAKGVPVNSSFRKYGGNGINRAVGIKAISQGNYLLYGTNQSSVTDKNATLFAIKLNSSLNYVWGKKYSAGLDQGLAISSVTENANGSFTFATGLETTVFLDQGGFHIPLYTEQHPAVIQVSSKGAVLSGKSFAYQTMDLAQFSKNSNGSYLLNGQTMAFDLSGGSTGDMDALYGNFNANVAPTWVKTLGGSKSDTGFIASQANGYHLSGSSNSWGAGNFDVLVGKLDATGDVLGCRYINDISMTQTTPTIKASNLNWQPQTAVLVKKGAISAKNVALTVTAATIKATNVCNN